MGIQQIKGTHIRHIASALAAGGLAFALFSFSISSLFENTDAFVLFAREEITLEKEVQVSSGDLGSNKEIDIKKDTSINGNLFSDDIELEKNVIINGNASLNDIKTKKDAQILGEKITPVSLPIANIPNTPIFQAGTQNFTF